MNKKGKFYVAIICAVMIIFLIAAYFKIVDFYKQNNDLSVARDIGSKQAAVLRAVREGERIGFYIDEAKKQVQLEASTTIACGEDYLNHKLLTGESCSGGSITEEYPVLSTILAGYPGGPLTSIVWKKNMTANKVLLESTKRIPIGTEQAAPVSTGTFNGIFTNWPTRYKVVMGPPYFEFRPWAVNSGRSTPPSVNHVGIDISTNAAIDEPITSIGKGMAQFRRDTRYNGDNNLIRVEQDNGLVIYYTHINAMTEPGEGVVLVPEQPGKIQVQVGDIIGKTIPHSDGVAPHLHFEVVTTSITVEAVRRLWPDHVSTPYETTQRDNYAVVSENGNKVWLNPFCFFDRELMTNEIKRENGRSIDPAAFAVCDIYERDLGLSGVLGSQSGPSTPQPAQTNNQQTAPNPLSRATSAFNLNILPGTSNTGTTNPSAQPTQTTQPASTSTQTSTTPMSTNRDVIATQNALERHVPNLMTVVQDASQRESVPVAALIAIMTAETLADDDAVSCTGAVGIAQFTSGTAGDYRQNPSDHVTACCAPDGRAPACPTGQTCCPANIRACSDPTNRLCNPQNDFRFDPAKSIYAQAKYVKFLLNRYKNREQGIVFALTAYNAGEGAMDGFIRETGSTQPTWDEVKAAIDRSSATPARKTEIKGYGDKMVRYYGAGGERTIAGTSYTSKQFGYYDLNLEIRDITPSEFDPIVSRINELIATCYTQVCIDSAATGMTSTTVTVTRELLNGTTGCLSPEERASAYLANQFSSCLDSPSNNCTCPFTNTATATYKITNGETKAIIVNGERVNAVSLQGLTREYLGDGERAVTVDYLDDTIREGNINAYVRGNDLSLSDSDSVPHFAIGVERISELYKTDDRLIFNTGTVTDACIQKPAPMAYCIRNIATPAKKAIIYLDMAGHSIPEATITVPPTAPRTINGKQYHQIFFTTTKAYPYIHVQGKNTTNEVDFYLMNYTETELLPQPPASAATDATPIDQMTIAPIPRPVGPLTFPGQSQDPTTGLEAISQAAGAGIYRAFYNNGNYFMVLPAYDEYNITLMDENLRETAATTFTPQVPAAP